MSLSAGHRLGPYEILSPLGAGGMGEVYKARDVRLGRAVAVKVLPVEFASDAGRLRRFELEARAASALNHPNIVTVHDVGTEGSTSYLAMEFVDGQTLRDVLLSGPLPLKKLLDLAAQIADGIAAAHEAGIVHRDLKPGNLMVTRDGFVKVLDFGLAHRDPHRSDGAGNQDSTVTAPPTMPGSVLGTVGYMSPEQARGENIDFRADQFSFGSILYEMATGARAFQRSSPVETLSAILNDEPDSISKRRPELPAPLRWIIERCLAKSPADRYSATRDLARELESVRDHLSELSGEQDAAAQTRPGRMRRLLPLIAILLAASLVGAIGWALSAGALRKTPEPDFRRLTLRTGFVSRALYVPRSNSILYTASWKGEPMGTYVTLPDAKGVDRRLEAPVQLPMAYTADGSEVLVLLGASRPALNPVGTLAWWPALGGKPRPIVENAGWADWAKTRGLLVVVRVEAGERMLEVLDATGTRLRTLFRTPGAISYVRVSPDESEVAFIHHPSRFDDAGEIRIARLDGSRDRAVSPRFERCRGLAWNSKTGEVWFTATRSIYNMALWAATTAGEVRLLYSFPDLMFLQDMLDGECLLVARTGETTLLIRRGEQAPVDFPWFGTTFICDVSPDQKSVLFVDGTAEERSVGTWVRPLDGGDALRIGDGEEGKFSPDGSRVVTTTRPGARPPQILLVSLGNGSTQQLTSSAASYSAVSFAGADSILFLKSKDGRAEVGRLGADGKGERSLGVTNCDLPSANPAASAFLCLGGLQENALVLYSLGEPSSSSISKEGRKLYELVDGDKFLYARWNDSGKQIHAVTNRRRFLTLDASAGTVVRDSVLPLPANINADAFRAAVCSPDGGLQAYSVDRLVTRLYLFRGM